MVKCTFTDKKTVKSKVITDAKQTWKKPLKNDSTKIRLRFNLKNHCGGYWFHQKWFLRWDSDNSKESLRAMHKFNDKLVKLKYACRMYDGWGDRLEKEKYISRHWMMKSSELETSTAIPGRVRPWNGVMVWELECTNNPKYMAETDLNKEFFVLLDQIKLLMQDFHFDLYDEKWRYSVIFKDSEWKESYQNNPPEWKERRKNINEYGCGPLEDVLSGKYLYCNRI